MSTVKSQTSRSTAFIHTEVQRMKNRSAEYPSTPSWAGREVKFAAKGMSLLNAFWKHPHFTSHPSTPTKNKWKVNLCSIICFHCVCRPHNGEAVWFWMVTQAVNESSSLFKEYVGLFPVYPHVDVSSDTSGKCRNSW